MISRHSLYYWIHTWIQNIWFLAYDFWHTISRYSSWSWNRTWIHTYEFIQDFMIMNSYAIFHDLWIQIWIHVYHPVWRILWNHYNHTWNHRYHGSRCSKRSESAEGAGPQPERRRPQRRPRHRADSQQRRTGLAGPLPEWLLFTPPTFGVRVIRPSRLGFVKASVPGHEPGRRNQRTFADVTASCLAMGRAAGTNGHSHRIFCW